jgi:hypothetical protein
VSNRWFSQFIMMATAVAPVARSTNGGGMNDGKLTASGTIVDGKNAITATTHIHDIKELNNARFLRTTSADARRGLGFRMRSRRTRLGLASSPS